MRKTHFLSHQMRIGLDTHDRRIIQNALVERLAEIGDHLNDQNAAGNLPKEPPVGGSVDLDAWIHCEGIRLLPHIQIVRCCM